jgi:hypothetical protein
VSKSGQGNEKLRYSNGDEFEGPMQYLQTIFNPVGQGKYRVAATGALYAGLLARPQEWHTKRGVMTSIQLTEWIGSNESAEMHVLRKISLRYCEALVQNPYAWQEIFAMASLKARGL